MSERKTDAVLKNIAELNRRERITREQSALCVSMLAELADDGARESLDALYAKFKESCDTLSVAQRIDFCRKLCELRNIRDISDLPAFSDASLPVPAGAHGKICFLRNRYNDTAFNIFSRAIPHSKAIYFSDFEECCEAVAVGSCEFTILPVENTSDGKMFGFYSLIDRYELKISAVCKIESEDQARSVRYALLGRNALSAPFLKQKSKRRCFEFYMICDTGLESFDVFEAARACGLRLDGTSSIPLAYDDSRTRIYYSFSADERSELCALLLYLCLEFPLFTPVGIYGDNE